MKHKKASVLFMFFALVAVLVSNAFAALDLTGLTVDVAPVFEAAGIVILAIGSIWGIKKVIKLLNRS